MVALVVSIAATAAAAAPASADYPVRACRDAPGGINRSWSPSLSPSGYLEALDTCGASGAYDGLVIRDRLGGPPDATSADSGWWTITAPPGTALTSLEYSRFLEAYSDAGWKPESRRRSATGTQTVFETCTFSGAQDRCSVGTAGGASHAVSVEAASVSIGGHCAPTATNTVCERGASIHSLRSILYGATVRLADLEDPTIHGSGSTSLAGGWRNATTGTVTVDASDNTGIRHRRIYVDGELRQEEQPTVPGGCQDPLGDAYTYLTPCAGARGLNGARATTLTSLRAWGEGTHTLEVRVADTDGRQSVTGPMTVKLDFSAPPAPVPVATGGSAWRNTAGGEVNWQVPAEVDRAPVSQVAVEACPPAGSCSVTVAPGGAFGATLSHHLASLPEGESRIRVRHTDQAGNAGAWSPAIILRRDKTPPTLRALDFPAATVPVGTSLGAEASFEDPLSGMLEQERQIRFDDGDWRPQAGTWTADPGRIYRLRVRGADVAGNVSAWHTSEPISVSTPGSESPAVPGPSSSPVPGPTTTSPAPGKAARPSARLRVRSAVLDSSRRVLTARGTTARGVTGTVRLRAEIRRGARTVTRTFSVTIRRNRFSLRRRLKRADAHGRIRVSARYAGSRAHRPDTTMRRNVLVRR